MAVRQSEKEEEVLDEIADRIADMIVNSKKFAGISGIVEKEKESADVGSDKYLDNIIELKHRISVLESKTDRKIQDFEIIINDLERQLDEKYNSVSKENEGEYFRIIDQLAKLRAAVIRLSNEIKEIKVQMALKKF